MKHSVHRIAGKLHKLCPHCRRILPVEKFSADRARVSGLKSWCRECRQGGRKKIRRVGITVDPKAVMRGVREVLE